MRFIISERGRFPPWGGAPENSPIKQPIDMPTQHHGLTKWAVSPEMI